MRIIALFALVEKQGLVENYCSYVSFPKIREKLSIFGRI